MSKLYLLPCPFCKAKPYIFDHKQSAAVKHEASCFLVNNGWAALILEKEFNTWNTRPPSKDQELIRELQECVEELIEEAEYAAECCGMSDDEQEVVDSIKEKVMRAKQALKSTEGGQ